MRACSRSKGQAHVIILSHTYFLALFKRTCDGVAVEVDITGVIMSAKLLSLMNNLILQVLAETGCFRARCQTLTLLNQMMGEHARIAPYLAESAHIPTLRIRPDQASTRGRCLWLKDMSELVSLTLPPHTNMVVSVENLPKLY